MIKGTNRRMFRRPRPAREASGILASSQELINQVLPLRMQNGGDPFAELKKLIEAQSAETKEPGFRELIRSLGVGALQSEFADPSRGTVENFARALPFALESVDKKRDEARAQALALAQARGKIASEERSLQAASQLAQQRDLTMTKELIRNKFGSDKLTDFLRSEGINFGINDKGVPVAEYKGKQAADPIELKKLLPQNILTTFEAIAEGTSGGLALQDRQLAGKKDHTIPLNQRFDIMGQFIQTQSGGDKRVAEVTRSRQIEDIVRYPEFAGLKDDKFELPMDDGRTAPSGKARFLGRLLNKEIDDIGLLGAFAETDVSTGKPRVLFYEIGSSRAFGQRYGELSADQYDKLDPRDRQALELAFPQLRDKLEALRQ